MTVLVAHNYYQQAGGEDQVFHAETELLEGRGHRVIRFMADNSDINQTSYSSLVSKTIWSNSAYKDLRRVIQRERPQIVHVHNTLLLLSPSIYYAAQHEGVPVVQTLHNYRLLCPNALLYRKGTVCELCLHKSVAWPSIVHSCYRRSRVASGVVTAMLAGHRLSGTWRNKVDLYIALTEFARQKFIEGGIPPEKLVVKPNFIGSDPGRGSGDGTYALYVGRLSPEKGLDTLLSAWRLLEGKLDLKIVGDGPLSKMVAEAARTIPGVEWVGETSSDEIYRLMRSAKVCVVPSQCYETFGRVVIEAYSTDLPVIASNHGSMSSMVEHGRTGLHFEPGNASDLAVQLLWSMEHPEEMARMRLAARAEYEAKYTADHNYEMLMAIYEKVIAQRSKLVEVV